MFRKNKNTTKAAVSVILLGLLIFLGNTSLLGWSRNTFFNFTGGIRYIVFSTAQGLFSRLSLAFKEGDAIKENLALKEENQNLSAKLAFFYLLEEENKILRQALKIKQEKNRESVIAFVTGFQRQFRDEFLFLNAGSENGISAGDLIITGDNNFIGRIKEVWSKTARAEISSSASESYDAILLPQGLPVLARGSNNQEIFLDLVPGDAEVKVGDIAVTSGKGDIFLDGLIVGRVASSHKLDNQIFQSVFVKAGYDPNFLRKIIIVKK